MGVNINLDGKIVNKYLGKLMATLTAALLTSSASGAYAESISEICNDPEAIELNQKLWDFVQSQDSVEVYAAYLDACGTSNLPFLVQYLELARTIVVERTAGLTEPLPIYVISFAPDQKDPFEASYVR